MVADTCVWGDTCIELTRGGQKSGCGSTISTVNDLVSKQPSAHNHEATEAKVQIKKTMHRLKLKAQTTLKPMPSLYNEELLSLREGSWTADNTSVIESMPTFATVKSQLYSARRATFPQIPTRRRDIVVPDEYTTTDAGERFLCINDGDDDKILGFTTRQNLQHLCAADVIYGDGTFYVAPSLYLQLYTIHAKVADQMFPLVFLLLPNKTRETYTRAFQLVKDAGFQLLPQTIQVEEAWLETLATMPQDDRCLQLTDYITTQWVEGDLPSWNHFETDGPRTNNHLEGWHGRMKKVINKAHPNVFEMAKFLLDEQKLNEIRLVQYRAGQKLPAKRTKYQNLDTRLNNLNNRLTIGVLPLMEYADAASHLLKLN